MPSDRLGVVVRAWLHSSSPRHTAAASIEGASSAPAPPTEAEPSSVERTLQAGLIAGIIGYAVVAVFLVVAGILDGRSSFDAGALLRGTLFFGTGEGPDAMIVTGPVFAYSGPRLVTFLIAGVLIAWLAANAGRAPRVWLVALMLLLFVAAPVMGVPILFEERVQADLSPIVVIVATSLAALAMSAYFWKVGPGLQAAMEQPSGSAEPDDGQ